MKSWQIRHTLYNVYKQRCRQCDGVKKNDQFTNFPLLKTNTYKKCFEVHFRTKMEEVPSVSVSKILESFQQKSKTEQRKAPIRQKNKLGKVAKVVQVHTNKPE